jgi:hypothetical protein
MIEVVFLLILVLCITIISLYKNRFKALLFFVLIETSILIPTLAYSGNSFRLHVGILGTFFGYLALLIFFIYIIIVKKKGKNDFKL